MASERSWCASIGGSLVEFLKITHDSRVYVRGDDGQMHEVFLSSARIKQLRSGHETLDCCAALAAEVAAAIGRRAPQLKIA